MKNYKKKMKNDNEEEIVKKMWRKWVINSEKYNGKNNDVYFSSSSS